MDILAGADLLNGRHIGSDPAQPIVTAAAAGELTAAKLDQLVTEAAHGQLVDAYVGELRQRSERMFITAFHKALEAGACDELLNTLRPAWNEHAEAIDRARGQINAESSAQSGLGGTGKLTSSLSEVPDSEQPVLDVAHSISSARSTAGAGHYPVSGE